MCYKQKKRARKLHLQSCAHTHTQTFLHIDTMSERLATFLRGHITFVEGNMCAAKSTLCKAIEDSFSGKESTLEVFVFLEGFDAALLAKFNENPKKYAWALQANQQYRCDNAIIEAKRKLKEKNYSCACIVDRGRLGNAAFARVHVSNGNMTRDAFADYLRRFVDEPHAKNPGHLDAIRAKLPDTESLSDIELLERLLFTQDDARYVFVDVEPRVAYERCKKVRQRSEESNNELEYFEQIGAQHTRYMDAIAPHVDRVVRMHNNRPLVKPAEQLLQLLIDALDSSSLVK